MKLEDLEMVFLLCYLITFKILRYSKYFKKNYDIEKFAFDLYNVIFLGMFLKVLKQILV